VAVWVAKATVARVAKENLMMNAVLGKCGNACVMGGECDGIAQDWVNKRVFEGEMFLQEKRNVCWSSQTNGGRELQLLASRAMRSPTVSCEE